MTKDDALKLLAFAPRSEIKKSKINPAFTQAEIVNIVRKGIASQDNADLNRLMTKRLWQVMENRKRPKMDVSASEMLNNLVDTLEEDERGKP